MAPCVDVSHGDDLQEFATRTSARVEAIRRKWLVVTDELGPRSICLGVFSADPDPTPTGGKADDSTAARRARAGRVLRRVPRSARRAFVQSIRSASAGRIDAARYAGIAADIIVATDSTRLTATSTTGSFRFSINDRATTVLSPTLNARPAKRLATMAKTAGCT